MFEFLTGIVLGAILGVIADRLWRKFENRVQVQISGGHYATINHEEGFSFTITNDGKTAIPDYAIWIFHPRRGSLGVFKSDSTGPLLPDQERHHECAVLEDGKVDDILAGWFLKINGELVSPKDKGGYRFRLVMKNSERIIYENASMGEALAQQFIKVLKTKNFQEITFEEAKALQTPKEKRLPRGIRQVIKLLKKDKPGG